MNGSTNAINWFEIPVSDMARAKHFYQVIFSMHMNENEMMGTKMAYFPFEMGNGKVSGALVEGGMNQPGQSGPLIYLNANHMMDGVLEKIEPMGGSIIKGKTQISPEIGFMAIFQDTEGNRIALHSQD
ncbi:MAG: VOC family protein [Bacteroidota bacterium]|nr:VOC family protein [Bacteroidota bacterium]